LIKLCQLITGHPCATPRLIKQLAFNILQLSIDTAQENQLLNKFRQRIFLNFDLAEFSTGEQRLLTGEKR